MAGLALAGVIVLTTVAMRRVRAHRKARSTFADRVVIDGVRDLEDYELDARPQYEANAAPERLESEAGDVVENSQRW
jgi:hypothetical protein